MVAVSDFWSTIPLFILFREAIEASIIVSVLISFTRRKNAVFLEKQVWWGVGLGVAVSILFGIIFIVLYYKAAQNLFSGPNQMLFKGIVSWIACLMITYLAFTMLQFFGWEDKWKRKLDIIAAKQLKQAEEQAAASAKAACHAAATEEGLSVELESVQDFESPKERWMTKNAFFIAIFLTVVREGLESVVFLAGVGNSLSTRECPSCTLSHPSESILTSALCSLRYSPPWICGNPLWTQRRLHLVLHWEGSH